MKNIFKPEDFPNLLGLREQAADDANEKMNKLIESWQVVYGRKVSGVFWFCDPKSGMDTSPETHTACLAFVEEINQAPEECHYVESGFTINNEPMYKRVKK